jgi:hypothetical protein
MVTRDTAWRAAHAECKQGGDVDMALAFGTTYKKNTRHPLLFSVYIFKLQQLYF